ncbi:MAG: hypothetical protein K9M15_02590 [Candidatus Marinimicrobia bacterium]|nr:hypothetical protein [Candidatus Neomarinimicrobiota bacterium]
MGKVVSLLLCIFFLVCCSSLEIKKENYPSDQERKELEYILKHLDYGRPYKEGVFDCSNQSALLYDFLSARDYKCKIIVGFEQLIGGVRHAWVVAEKNGKIFIIEPVYKCLVTTNRYKGYTLQIEFDSLENLRSFCSFFGFENEWKY